MGTSSEYGYFSWGSSEIQKDFLAPDFYLNYFFLSIFLLFNKRILLLSLLAQTESFFVVEEWYLLKTLYLMGKASQLAVLTFNNSPLTRLVALKCCSARELVISETLNSVRQTTANVCAQRQLVDLAGTNITLQARWAHGGVTVVTFYHLIF